MKEKNILSKFIEEQEKLGNITFADEPLVIGTKLIKKKVWDELPAKAQRVLSENGFYFD